MGFILSARLEIHLVYCRLMCTQLGVGKRSLVVFNICERRLLCGVATLILGWHATGAVLILTRDVCKRQNAQSPAIVETSEVSETYCTLDRLHCMLYNGFQKTNRPSSFAKQAWQLRASTTTPRYSRDG